MCVMTIAQQYRQYRVRSRPFDSGGGGVEENVPEQSIYLFQVWEQFFYFTMSVKQIFLFVPTKDETIIFHAYYSKPMGHAASFHTNMCNLVGRESSVGCNKNPGKRFQFGSGD